MVPAVAGALGIDSTARLFDSHHQLAAHVSAIDYPVFVNGRNYGGTSPALTRHPVLRSLVRASLGPRLDMAPGALVVPLGKAAQSALAFLAAEGLVDPARCLLGFPHPSGANGWRVRQYAARRHHLAGEIARWAATAAGRPARPVLARPPDPPRVPSLPETRPEGVPVTGAGASWPQDDARIVIRLTGGNVRNSYVSVAAHMSFFPGDAVGAANSKDGVGTLLTLHFTGLPEAVQTDIAGNHKTFRSRAPWRAFVACHGLAEGDAVVIERLSAYEYRISPTR